MQQHDRRARSGSAAPSTNAPTRSRTLASPHSAVAQQPVRQREERPDDADNSITDQRATGLAAAATGPTSDDEKSATPMNTSTAPPSMKISTCAVPRPRGTGRWRARRSRAPPSTTATDEAVPREAAGRQGRALAHGGDRRHAGRAHRRPQAREQRDEDADEQRHDHRPGLQREPVVGQREADRVEQPEEALGERDPEQAARSPTRSRPSRAPRRSPCAAPGGARRRGCAAWRTRACAGRS